MTGAGGARPKRRAALPYLWARHRPALVIMVIAAAFAAFFALRLVAFWIYWSEPAHHNQQIQPWMTPGYVARSYGVDPVEIRDMLAVPQDAPRGSTLEDIARMTGRDTGALIAVLQQRMGQSAGQDTGRE